MADAAASAGATGDASAPPSGQLIIPDDLRTKYPQIIELLLSSESMNDEERQYWVNILPVMTEDQVENLRQILVNERAQLAAIDRKYAKEIEQIGQEQLIKRTERERRSRREERVRIEEKARDRDDSSVDELLSQIDAT